MRLKQLNLAAAIAAALSFSHSASVYAQDASNLNSRPNVAASATAHAAAERAETRKYTDEHHQSLTGNSLEWGGATIESSDRVVDRLNKTDIFIDETKANQDRYDSELAKRPTNPEVCKMMGGYWKEADYMYLWGYYKRAGNGTYDYNTRDPHVWQYEKAPAGYKNLPFHFVDVDSDGKASNKLTVSEGTEYAYEYTLQEGDYIENVFSVPFIVTDENPKLAGTFREVEGGTEPDTYYKVMGNNWIFNGIKNIRDSSKLDVSEATYDAYLATWKVPSTVAPFEEGEKADLYQLNMWYDRDGTHERNMGVARATRWRVGPHCATTDAPDYLNYGKSDQVPGGGWHQYEVFDPYN